MNNGSDDLGHLDYARIGKIYGPVWLICLVMPYVGLYLFGPWGAIGGSLLAYAVWAASALERITGRQYSWFVQGATFHFGLLCQSWLVAILIGLFCLVRPYFAKQHLPAASPAHAQKLQP